MESKKYSRNFLFTAVLLILLVSAAVAQDEDVPPPEISEITQLKDLHRSTPLVEDGRPAAVIVAPGSGRYDEAARQVQDAIRRVTGVRVPVVDETSPEAAVPLTNHLIALGNRSTNPVISTLYDRHYTLLDRKYPGSGGYVVRSVHDLFGNGYNVIYAGGSDREGVEEAVRVLMEQLKGDRERGQLHVGWMMEIQLSDQYEVPADIEEVTHWGESPGYEGRNTFGWNTIAKNMALYYMTGRKQYAREVVRLAFPDEKAQEQLLEWDGETYKNIDDPLSHLHHYYHHNTILYWDLIEESSAFSDRERLEITRSLADDFTNGRLGEGIYELTEPPKYAGGRHQQYSALTMYVLAQYFNKHYPDPVWEHALRASANRFKALYETAWLDGTEGENGWWYSTYYAPTIMYMLLSGDREPMAVGTMPKIFRGQEILATGRAPGFALYYASLKQLNQTAYLTGEDQWLRYRQRLGLQTDMFRLGQSFWPDKLQPGAPTHLVGTWSIHPLAHRFWKEEIDDFPYEQGFLWASYRSRPDDGGDFILLDGHDGKNRNPHHAFAILELRIGGQDILRARSQGRQATLNQVRTFADGMVNPKVKTSAALRDKSVVGQTATVIGEVKELGFSDWRRTIAQRLGRYALVVDDVMFGKNTKNMQMQTIWQGQEVRWNEAEQVLELPDRAAATDEPPVGQIRMSDVLSMQVEEETARAIWRGTVEKGERRIQFSLITPDQGHANDALASLRVADNAAVLKVPEPALAAVGTYLGLESDLVVLAENYLFAGGARQIGLEEKLLTADRPVDVDWDFEAGRLSISAPEAATVRFRTADQGMREVTVNGQQTLEGVYPGTRFKAAVVDILEEQLAKGRRIRERQLQDAAQEKALPGKSISPAWSTGLHEDIAALEVGRVGGQPRLMVAEGKSIHVFTPDGEQLNTMQADGNIAAVHWWPEAAEHAGQPLLVAGCMDQQVIAFNLEGERVWEHATKMAPEFVAQNNPRWGYASDPGARGLASGRFLEGKQQLFVGSASTLEVLNPDGSVALRRAVPKGIPQYFQLMPGPGHSQTLLVGNKPSSQMDMAVINNETPRETKQSFYEVPEGHTYIRNWARMRRQHIFYEDLDGDGDKEVTSEITGFWNRVSVWEPDGTPVSNVQFGPGKRMPEHAIRDFDVADLEGDDTKEILVGKIDGDLVVLDHQLELVWSKVLTSAPEVFTTVRPEGQKERRIVVGLEDGTVLIFDREGTVLLRSSIDGRPTQIAVVDGAKGPRVVFGTSRGTVAAFAVN